MMSFSPSNYWCKQIEFCPGFKFFHSIHNFLNTLLLNTTTTFPTVGFTNVSKQQAEIIVYFRYSSHSGAGIPCRGPLFYRYGRRQSFNCIHFWFFHETDKLPGIGGEGLYISPLSFCIDGIKGQRGFPRTGESCNNSKPVPWDIQVNIFQVVFPGSPDDNFFQYASTHLVWFQEKWTVANLPISTDF